MTRSDRMTEGAGAALVAEWRKSGLSMSAFSRSKGLSAERVSYWKRRFDKKPPESEASGDFLVTTTETLRGKTVPAENVGIIEVLIGERFRVRIPAELGALQDILLALDAVSE